jgi:hypothetical protein
MTEPNYKSLAAQRLAIDPNALLNYFEFHDHVLCTTPDGRQHKFSFTDLRRPAPGRGGSSGELHPQTRPSDATKTVARPAPGTKTVAKENDPGNQVKSKNVAPSSKTKPKK